MYPATSSLSASGRSNGARFVSPKIEMTKMMKLGSRISAYQAGAVGCQPAMFHETDDSPPWAATMPDVDIVPAVMNTATMESPIATSYEMTWADERRPPSRG